MRINHSFYCCVVPRIAKVGHTVFRRFLLKKWVGCFLLLFSAQLVLTQAIFASENQGITSRQSKKAVCPAQKFPEFFAAYANSEAVQRTFLLVPLKTQRLDLDAEPEPKPVVKKLEYEQIRFPVVPLRAERESKLLSLRINKWSGKKAEATLFKQDTGYQVTYLFVKSECWALVAIDDWSM